MDNADLTKLIVAPGKLLPKFNPSVTSYSATVGSNVSEVKLTALTSDAGASYSIKGGDGSKVIKLAEGQLLEITVEVTAEDGRTNKNYTITLKRFSPNDATLSGLELSAGVIAPPFNPAVSKYTCNLPSCIDSISLKPKVEDKNMKVTLFGDQPITAVNLQHSQTNFTLTVTSANGSVTADYQFTVIKQPIMYSITLVGQTPCCAICSNVPHCPHKIKIGGKLSDSIYCLTCLQDLTRTNKQDPISGKPLEDEWLQFDEEIEKRISNEIARCQLPGGMTEAPLAHMGSSIRSNRLAAKKEEATQSCPNCSCKLLTCDASFHTELICSAKHSQSSTSTSKVEVLPWERRLQMVGEHQFESLLKQGVELEGQYCKLLAGCTSHTSLADNKHKLLEFLSSAASCYATAIKLRSKDPQPHVSLATILEESFYLEDLYGFKKEQQEASDDDVDDEVAEAASEDSKEEEFLAICKLRGVAPGADLALQLRAVEQEYHMLKETGQSAKADHVQSLHAWRSKCALQQSQGTYSSGTESSIGKSFRKYSDALQLGIIHSSSYNMGRTLLLKGDHETALRHLKTALGIKPIHIETRFCLGIAMAQQSAPPPHCKKLLEDGLETFLDHMSNVAETEAEKRVSYVNGDLLARTFWQPSNLLIARGFISLAKLGGGVWLTVQTCLRQTARLLSTAGLPNRGHTHQGLLWSLVEARALLLEATKDKNEAIRLCQELSGLLATCGLEKNNQLRAMKMRVCHLGVKLEPWSSIALCHLGNTQLDEYEVTEASSDLKNAELSFRGSIALEGKPSRGAGIPEQLSQQSWYQADKPQPTASEQPAKQTATKSSQPAAASATKTTGKQATTGKVVSPTRSKTQQPAAVKGKAATSTVAANSRSGRTANNPVTRAMASKVPAKSTPANAGKGVATLGELKAGSSGGNKPTAPPTKEEPSKSAAPVAKEGTIKEVVDSTAPINERSHHPRLGLARVLVKQKSPQEAAALYREVITMAPHIHDAYIELGEMLATDDPLAAVDVYCKFPFSAELTFDDAYLYGEIVQLLMKKESYDDPRLLQYMVAMGKVLGLSALEKHVTKLEGNFQTKLLRSVYAGVNNRDVNDIELQAFFKFKCWI